MKNKKEPCKKITNYKLQIPKMERTLRINELIKEQISQIIFQEKTDDFLNVLATVTRVETSSNLIQSKVYISCISARNASATTSQILADAGGPEAQADKIISSLTKRIYKLQQELNKRLRIRPVPKIIFVRDEMPQEAEKIETILDKIKKQGK